MGGFVGTLVGSLEGAQVVAELEILGFAEIVGFLEAVELKVLFAVGLFEIILGHTAVGLYENEGGAENNFEEGFELGVEVRFDG